MFSNLTSSHTSAWDFNHCAEFIIDFNTLFSHHILRDLDQCRLNVFEFVHMPGQWDHDLGMGINSIQFGIASGFKDCTDLHFHNVRIDDTQADAAQTHHWVAFVQPLDNFQHRFFFSQTFGDAPGFQSGDLDEQFIHGWQKLVQRGIDQANDYWQTSHRFEQTIKVAALQGQDLFQRAKICPGCGRIIHFSFFGFKRCLEFDSVFIGHSATFVTTGCQRGFESFNFVDHALGCFRVHDHFLNVR